MKKKKSDKKKNDKKKSDKGQQILNYIIITILTVVFTFSYCQQKRALEVMKTQISLSGVGFQKGLIYPNTKIKYRLYKTG